MAEVVLYVCDGVRDLLWGLWLGLRWRGWWWRWVGRCVMRFYFVDVLGVVGEFGRRCGQLRGPADFALFGKCFDAVADVFVGGRWWLCLLCCFLCGEEELPLPSPKVVEALLE